MSVTKKICISMAAALAFSPVSGREIRGTSARPEAFFPSQAVISGPDETSDGPVILIENSGRIEVGFKITEVINELLERYK